MKITHTETEQDFLDDQITTWFNVEGRVVGVTELDGDVALIAKHDDGACEGTHSIKDNEMLGKLLPLHKKIVAAMA